MRYVSHWPSLVPLLFLAVYLPHGTHRARGFTRRCACTTVSYAITTAQSFGASVKGKGLGMRSGTCTAAPLMGAACSFSSLRGRASAVLRRRYKPSPIVLRVNSYTGHGSSTSVTDTRGVSGGQLTSAA